MFFLLLIETLMLSCYPAPPSCDGVCHNTAEGVGSTIGGTECYFPDECVVYYEERAERIERCSTFTFEEELCERIF